MEIQSLDLRDQRCPMSLLLVKRACTGLDKGQGLMIMISDAASEQDIHRYLLKQAFQVTKSTDAFATVLLVIKQ
ncbi:sirA-like family protein [Veronia nyctiphanis]|uniref:SirA-like family protein n=1 Tax=Veronia nyctiphanis TaxID=1278244 RepID=A0A4Q0YM02_9GAMM|nr:sulfurtransferase TusA family protein [Veronia nyctiphanis]RXJ71453.1 sirA-like family protein [Veronia nyctiphanis]